MTHSLVQSIIELSRTQDEEVGDGTTSVIILGATSAHTCRVVVCMLAHHAQQTPRSPSPSARVSIYLIT